MADLIPLMTKDNIPFRLFPYKNESCTIILVDNLSVGIDITYCKDDINTFHISKGINSYSLWYISKYGYLI